MNKKTQKIHPLVKNLPVAKLFYKGSHTHPVWRTLLITESTSTYLRGYELREGRVSRKFKEAPIKTYRRDNIARVGDIDARRVLRANAKKNQLNQTTLKRLPLVSLVVEGA